MKNEMVIHQQNIYLSVSPAFINALHSELLHWPDYSASRSVILNFRHDDYLNESGGFHPVEVRLIKRNEEWFFDYLTDFSYMGHPYPELEKEFDISWSQGYVWHYVMGDMKIDDGEELFELWQRNFIRYWKAKIYTVITSWE
ncbi:DUF2787 family protein [Salmonella enterica]|nr:DUF2787 family protein [Salmonella enterica]EHM4534133.1 DUF2787 family protein [Salmonella enterica subsp. enterica serovar Poona]ELJ2721981.1 DUF2787 family protein [Salmonella enterica subsp. enterica]EHK4271939.1 DUF2787 family protein [Salmonella enterica]EHK4420499.1 DUF2787 family protein [Salmonella enterica]